MLCEWCKNVLNKGACLELDVMPATVTRWYNKFNKIAYDYAFKNIEYQQIGGKETIVEIDQTLLVKQKYHRGRSLANQVWAVGGVVRGDPTTFFVEIVKNRNRETMIELIKRKIRPGTEIQTDCWCGYLGLQDICFELGFVHKTVNHSVNFIDSVTGANTQTIEGMWPVIKRELQKEGTNYGDFINVIQKIYIKRFKLLFKNNLLEKMLSLLKKES